MTTPQLPILTSTFRSCWTIPTDIGQQFFQVNSTSSTSLRKLTEEMPVMASLDTATQNLHQITEGASDLLVLVDAELRIVFANRLLDKLAHAESPIAPSRVGCFIGDFFPPRSRDRVLLCLRSVIQLGISDRFDVEVAASNGRMRYQEIRVSPVVESGRVTALVLNGSDITQHVLAHRAVATQARMIESMLEGVALIDANQDIVITNPALDALFGFDRGMLIGWPLAQLASAVSFSPELLNAAKQGSGPWPLEFEARRKGARITVAGALSRLRDTQSEHYLLVLQDVTERKHLERAMLEAVSREQYRIGNDLHDGLGQELTGIALMLRCLAGRLAAEHRQVLPDVEGITRLVNNAVESTRSLARGLSPVNLERGGLRDALAGLTMHARTIYGIKALFANRMDPNINLDAELANHLYRIAQEAVTNAVKHGHAKMVRIQLSSARKRVRLAVVDDGCGMPADTASASGLGLRIMRYRSRIASGDLRFEAVEPSGTRIVCECPIEQPSVTSATSERVRRKPTNPAAADSGRHHREPTRARTARKS
jgi:PAS domain S-box-containing protein